MTDPGTAVAKSSPPKSTLTPEQMARIEARRMHSKMVQAIRGATWAKEFDAYTIAAVAEWSRRNDIDPITEIDVLGGNIYPNARYYYRQLSKLIGANQIEYARPDWVHSDPRLDSADEAFATERRRRLAERIRHNLSDKADAACVFRIKHRAMTEEVTGAKEHVPGKRKDPVGDAAPMETIETRALRRAMLKLKEAFPQLPVMTTKDEDFVAMAEVIESARDEVRAMPKIGAAPIMDLPQGDPYGQGDTPVRATIKQEMPDPIPPEEPEFIDDRDIDDTPSLGLEPSPKRRKDAIREGR